MKATEKEYVDTLVMFGTISGAFLMLALFSWKDNPIYSLLMMVSGLLTYYNVVTWTYENFDNEDEEIQFQRWKLPFYGEIGGNDG